MVKDELPECQAVLVVARSLRVSHQLVEEREVDRPIALALNHTPVLVARRQQIASIGAHGSLKHVGLRRR
jgi:hypothetical protein